MELDESGIKFVKHCLNRGNQEDERIFKFFSYYIALNYLYGTYNTYNRTYDTELNLLKNFLSGYFNTRYESHECLNVFNDLRSLLGENSALLKKPVDNRVRIVDPLTLFENVYRVRCNLFHGSKHMNNERDDKLIDECNIVLSTFLTCILEMAE